MGIDLHLKAKIDRVTQRDHPRPIKSFPQGNHAMWDRYTQFAINSQVSYQQDEWVFFHFDTW